jgi:hypothetical protein
MVVALAFFVDNKQKKEADESAPLEIYPCG